uniref:Nucleotidyl transferase n=1 Tax=Pithovirus LCPAC404 TaxID=2506597 RepID=A0A481ZBX8_9VIRU|nr:MAG: nucleotidyl transferase [Pithovirus LCPAC404]
MSRPLAPSTSKSNIAIRNPNDYSEALKFVLDIVTINERPNVVGSAKYRGFKYSSDVDVFEAVSVNTCKEEAIALYANLISTIAAEIAMTNREILFNNFRAGMDNRYCFNITGKTTKCDMTKITDKLCSKGLICHEKHVELDKLACKGCWEEFAEQLRKLRTVRWKILDLINQRTILPLGKVMTLREAICMTSLVKLDVISYIEGRLQSVEVIYLFKYTDKNRRQQAIQDLEDYTERIKEDFSRYSSKEHYDPLKLMKRLWSYSNFINCNKIVNLLLPLYTSDMSALNQVVADIEILRELIENHRMQPVKIMLLEATGFKKRLFNHLELEQYKKVYSHIDCVTTLWADIENGGKFDKETFLMMINELEHYLKKVIKKLSNEFLQKARSSFNTVKCRPINL